ncbi:MAG: restriction endonuclease subunit S [Cyanobacteria bacterium REEB65]|nr:restriction endonuclease subunit S [Cyanobacteria bacterium REEB65]
MASNWIPTRLGEVAKVRHGYAFEGHLICDEPTPDILVTPGNFEIGGGFKSAKLKYYRGRAPEGFILRPGELIVTMTDLSKASDTLGFSALVPKEPGLRFLHNQRIGKVEVTRPDLVDLGYLNWLLRTPEYRNEILAGSTGTAIKHTAPSRIEAFSFRRPPLQEQQAIAQILGALDDKIELNRRTNETLEAMARALFRSLFVDFEPVRAKLEGREPLGIDSQTFSGVPEGFSPSEIGPIPAGWRLGSLADMALLNPEGWSAKTRPARVNYVDLSNTKWGKIEAIQELAASEAPSRAQRILRPGDTIVGTVRPGNGSYAYVTGDGLTGSTGFAVLRPFRANAREFVYLAATSPDNIDVLAHLADGGAYPAVRPELVLETPVVIPPEEALTAFSCQCRPLLESIAGAEEQCRTLGAVRDALLPRLLSGDLRVPDAERLVVAAI